MIVPLEEYLPKIRAAAAARRDPDFKIIARTDSNAGMGFDEAIRRANAALAAGADIAFVEAPKTPQEVAEDQAQPESNPHSVVETHQFALAAALARVA